MAWPDDQDLEVTVRAAFGADLTQPPTAWTWTDLSTRLLDQPINIQRGVVVGARTSRTTSGTITLLNDDGALTPYHPGSPWWPHVDAGTPIDVAVRTRTTPIVSDTFSRTITPGWGNCETPAVPWTFSASAAHSTTGSSGQVTFSAVNQTRRARIAATHRDIDMTSDFTMGALATGAAVTSGHYFRGDAAITEWLWSALDFATTGVVSLRLRSGFTDIASASVPGLTYTGGTKIRLRTLAVGARIRVKAWAASGSEPAVWHLDHTVDVLTGPNTHIGLLSWVLAGNTNTLPYTMTFDDLTITQPRYPRLEGYITDIQPTFLPAGDGTFHSAVEVSVGGVGTVLDVRGADEWSPMRRGILGDINVPWAYWPAEDSDRATSVASGVVGQSPMQVAGPAVFEFDVGGPEDTLLQRYGSKALCSLAAGARLSGAFTASPTRNVWTVGLTAQVCAARVPTSEIRIMEWATSGTFSRWALVSTSTGHAVRAYNDTLGSTTTVCSSVNGVATLVGMDVQAEQSGGNILVRFLIDAAVYASGSVAGTLGAPNRIVINPDRVNTTASTDPFGIRWLAGHIAVHTTAVATSLPYYYDGPTLYRADQGWWQEPSHLRVARQCREAGVPFRQYGTAPTPTLLNAQQEGSTQDLLAAAVDAQSGGLLFEEAFGYALIDRSDRYNRPVTLTIDLATYRRSDGTDPAEILQPALPVRSPTVWTVERTGGSQGVAAASTAYRRRRGEITAKVTLDLLSDSDTVPHAHWRVHQVENADGAHYPAVSVDLAANPDLVDDWLLLTIGGRIQRVNQPTIAGVGIIDQVTEGLSETISRRAWAGTVDGAPSAPWQVGVYDDPDTRYDAATSTLAASTAPGVISLPLTCTDPADIWSTTATPYNLVIFGEVVTVTSMGAASGVGPYLQTATVTRAVNGINKTLPSGSRVGLARPARYAL